MLRYLGAAGSKLLWPGAREGSARPLGTSSNSKPQIADLAQDPRRGVLAARLSSLGALGAVEIEALESISSGGRAVRAEQIIVQEGQTTKHIHLLVEGFAYRFKMLASGDRQVLGFLIPGDLCDVHYTICSSPDHSLAALCDARIVDVPIESLAGLMKKYPAISLTLSRAELVESATLREWLVNLGQRSATARLAHLICELDARLRKIFRVASDGSFDLPINQGTLADALGLTTVHTNRVLQHLRREKLISFRQRRLTVLDRPRLVQLAGFDENYLHRQGSSASP